MAQRIRHLTTNQGIAGSSPAGVKNISQFLQGFLYGLVVRISGSHPGCQGSIPGNGKYFKLSKQSYPKNVPTRMGFEPTRAEPIGLAVQRLNHSATSSSCRKFPNKCRVSNLTHFPIPWEDKILCVGRESNPDQLLGRQLC